MDYIKFRETEFSNSFKTASSLIKKCKSISSKYSKKDDFYNDQKTDAFIFKLSSLFSKKRNLLSRIESYSTIS